MSTWDRTWLVREQEDEKIPSFILFFFITGSMVFAHDKWVIESTSSVFSILSSDITFITGSRFFGCGKWVIERNVTFQCWPKYLGSRYFENG